ncbi:ABC transporter permease [Tsukamurella sp. 1534]|uniref:ABC transporter permease n=1 Tax=Tsukamurella sp. 1534 TaxID=1151061 RepID=UPI00030113E4|nr:ABC transporter permease [Tsukamurella sp. 1534]
MIGRAIAAEVVKLMTVRATRWLLAGAMVLGLAIVLLVGIVTNKLGEDLDNEVVVALAPFSGLPGIPGIAVLASTVIGVLSVTTEYRYNTMRTTFLAVPNRWAAMTAKTAVVASVCALGFLLAEVLSIAVFAVVGGGGPSFDPFGEGAGTYVTLPIAAAFCAVLGIAVGAVLRNAAGAITLLLAYLFVVDNVITTVPQTREAGPYLPMSNLENFIGIRFGDFPWPGGVSFGYLVVVIGLLWLAAVTVVARRDA